MPNEFTRKLLKVWMPASYRIEVEGMLDEGWSDRLGGLCITCRKRPDQSTITTLTGRLKDQAALSGVLCTLYELHLPILTVENLPEENGDDWQMSDTSS